MNDSWVINAYRYPEVLLAVAACRAAPSTAAAPAVGEDLSLNTLGTRFWCRAGFRVSGGNPC